MERKRQIGVILLLILIIINLVIGGVFIFMLQEIQAPDIDVEFNLSEMTTDEMKFTTTLTIRNDNQYDLSIKNLKITGETPNGTIILNLQFNDSTIPAKRHSNLTRNGSLTFPTEFSSNIYSFVQGTFGINFAGIFEKTIPLHIDITASFQDILRNISVPILTVFAEVTDITEEGVGFSGILSVENPNTFDMYLDNCIARIETENGTLVGEFSPIQGRIIPNDISEFALNGTLILEALNAKVLTLQITGNTSVHIMGIKKSIALAATAQLAIPDIQELLFGNESLGITISLDTKIQINGFLTTIGLALYNPSNIPLQANDLLCSVYGLTGNDQKMIAEKPMKASTLASKQHDYLETQILIPHIKLLTAGTTKILPDWFVIRIQGNFSIVGVHQSIPVTLYATINPHIL